MSNLNQVDWLIILLYVICALGIGRFLRNSIKTTNDFFLAGRFVPVWVTSLALAGISLGAPELLGMAGWGARYGLQVAQLCGIGAIPAMIFLGLCMMPVYYGSRARSVPEYLGMRYGPGLRAFSAALFLFSSAATAGIGLYAIARVIQALHLLDPLLRQFDLGQNGAFAVSMAICSVLVLAYVVTSGFMSTIYNQALQFCVTVAGLLPIVLIGTKSAGGCAGLKASLAASLLHEWHGALHPDANPMHIGMVKLALGVGLALGAGFWCTNVTVLQAALASRDLDSARRAPLIAAFPKMLLPFLVLLPGLVAITLPTPHSKTVVTREPDGSIVHNIQVAPREAELGKGIVPAQADRDGHLVRTASGAPVLDYDLTMPNMLLQFLPAGLLGLGVAALLASFMSGVAGNLAALSMVFTLDIYQPRLRPESTEEHLVGAGRLSVVGGLLLAIPMAMLAARFDNLLEPLLLVVSVVNAPLLAVLVLGMFWKRATRQGSLVGLAGGATAAILHYGLTLPADAQPGLRGAWLANLHRYPGSIAQVLAGSLFALGTSLGLAVLVSLATRPAPEAELEGLVFSSTSVAVQANPLWWKRPWLLAGAALLAALVLNVLFA